MNIMRLVFPRSIGIVITVLLSGFCWVTNAYSFDKDCWADFFDEAEYQGKHLLIEGAEQLPDLNNVNGESWDMRIHSLKVGPKAKVTVFENPKFELTPNDMSHRFDFLQSLGATQQDVKEDSELIFIANAKIHDLGDFNFHKKIRSLKVECN